MRLNPFLVLLLQVLSAVILALGVSFFAGQRAARVSPPAPTLSESWELKLSGDIYGEPIASSAQWGPDTLLLAGCADGKLYAISQQGQQAWVYQCPDTVYYSPCLLSNADIAVRTGSTLTGLDAQGHKRWETQLEGDQYHDLLPAPGGGVYLGGPEFYAFGPGGKEQYKFVLEGDNISSGPQRGPEGDLYFSTNGGWVVRMTAAHKRLWGQQVTPGPTGLRLDAPRGLLYMITQIGQPDPAKPGQLMYGGSGLLALDLNGRERWHFKPGDLWSSLVEDPPAIAPDGSVYLCSSGADLYALDSQGALKWQYGVNGSFESGATLGPDGNIYCVSSKQLVAFSPAGQLLWSFPVEGGNKTRPLVTPDGRVFLADGNRRLRCITPPKVADRGSKSRS